MHLLRITFSLFGLILATGILGVSLMASSKEAVAQGADESPTLYSVDHILPDNSLYPVLMVIDRIRLMTADDTEYPELYVQYSFDRLESATALLSKGKTDLAVTTLTKSQKYVLQAAAYTEQNDVSEETLAYVVQALKNHQETCERLIPELGDHADPVRVFGLETDAWITKLSS